MTTSIQPKKLPDKLWREIVCALPAPEVARATQVSKFFKGVIEQEVTWKQVAHNMCLDVDDQTPKKEQVNIYYRDANNYLFYRMDTQQVPYKKDIFSEGALVKHIYARNLLKQNPAELKIVIEVISNCKSPNLALLNSLVDDWIAIYGAKAWTEAMGSRGLGPLALSFLIKKGIQPNNIPKMNIETLASLVIKLYKEPKHKKIVSDFIKQILILQNKGGANPFYRILNLRKVKIDFEILEFFLNQGIQMDEETLFGWHALTDPTILQFLLDKGAKIAGGELNMGIIRGAPIEPMNILLKNGAQITERDVALAKEENRQDVLDLFKKWQLAEQNGGK